MKNALRLLAILLLLAGMSLHPCRAELSELQVKSAYVFNFIKFVEWPAGAIEPGGDVRLCVIGNEELRDTLAALDGRKVGAYELDVVPRREGGNGWSDCHVLYIGEQEQRRFIQILKSLGDASVLTISDIPDFAERGGGIGLLYREDRVVFEVNLATTARAGLRLSGQMLNLAANIFGRR